MKKKNWILIGILVVVIICLAVAGCFYYSEQESFEIKGALIQLNMPLNGEASNTNIKLINNEKTEKTFYLEVENLDGIASLKENEFILEAKGEKNLEVFFEDPFGEVKVYVGKLIVKNSEMQEMIPVFLGVQDDRSPFSIIQTPLPNYQNVYPGGEFGIQLKVIEANPSATQKSVDMTYSLMNFEGEVLEETQSNVLIGESWTKIISIPKDFKKDDYIFATLIEYKGVKSIAAHKFSVEDKKPTALVENLKFLIIIILIFVLGVLILFFHFAKSRDELLVALKKQQSEELGRNLKFIRQSRSQLGRIKDKRKRASKLKELGKVKKAVVGRIKKKQKEQRKKISELKKKKSKKPEMKKIIDSWKSQGFKMQETAEEMGAKNIAKQLNEFKKQGYKF